MRGSCPLLIILSTDCGTVAWLGVIIGVSIRGQRSEVKCLGINSWRDNYRPRAFWRGPAWARTHHQGEGVQKRRTHTHMFDLLWLSSLSLALLMPLILWSWHTDLSEAVCVRVCVCLCACVCLQVCVCVCFTWQASHLTAPPPVVRSLLTVQSLPGQLGSGKTTWNNLRTMSVRERDYLISFTTCHATGGSALSL